LAAVGKRWLFGSCEQVKQKVKGLGGVVFQNQRQCVVSASELCLLVLRTGLLGSVSRAKFASEIWPNPGNLAKSTKANCLNFTSELPKPNGTA